MTIEYWLTAATADAEQRGLPALTPLLETLARATTVLRAASFNERADPRSSVVSRPPSDNSDQT